ncbi:hypothetical protein ACP70R_031109 [Stipagrostis hirtigluma subsp. patula]
MDFHRSNSHNMSSISSHCELPLLLLLLHVFLGSHFSYSLGTYSNQTAIPTPCRPDQASALLRLKRSFSTNGWGPFDDGSICTLASWQAGTDCCRWEGVRCGDADGRVTTLDLGECGLESGGLHPALFELTSVRHLNLAWNSFNGSQLPSVGFERLTKLIHLNLSSCGFAGPIPEGIGRLTKLVSLDLSTTIYLKDAFDDFYVIESWSSSSILREPNIGSLVGNLSNLKYLYLGTVDLSGNGATWCSVFANSTPQLQVLSLPACLLHGPLCGSLSGIHSLTEIYLPYNSISGQIPDSFADIPSLSDIVLTFNFIHGWFPPKIFQNRNITTIDVRYNFELSGSLPNFSSDSILMNLLVSNTNFSGPIPSTIGNIKSLNRLGLAATDFSQGLPSSIGELKSLRSLEVTGAGMVGEIPSWITNLTSLALLEFSNCGLSGEIPSSIGNLKNLTILKLYKCNFSGTLPLQLFNLNHLRVLYLDSNNFLGKVELSSFWKLPRLSSLNLSNNKFSVVVEGGDNSSSVNWMESLRLASCNISKFPDALRNMYRVSILDLSHNQIHGSIPQWTWETWNHMSILDLSYNKLSNIGHGSILPGDISFINLSYNLFEGPIPIPGPNTRALDCSNNRFSSIPLNIGSQLSSIAYFKASRNSLSGKILPSICDASGLQLLDLSHNNLSGSFPSCLMEDTNFTSNLKVSCALQALDLSYNQIEGQLPRCLVSCRDLEVLDVANNFLNDTFPCWVSMLPKLQVLVLKSNKFVGKVGPSILGDEDSCEFMNLRIIDLASNSFTGTLQNEWFRTLKSMMAKPSNDASSMEFQLDRKGPTYQFTTAIGYKGNEFTFTKILKTLVVIDVSDNAFDGPIPSSIGDLVLLSGINMSHNALGGQIPSQFGALDQLESLDLSSNNISGKIPQELASLNFLSMLNLSYNDLEGRIPESPHFLTFSNLSFLGNIGLCGFQVSKECNKVSPNTVQHHSEKKSVDIILFLLVGVGVGVGFAIAIVVTWGVRVRRRSEEGTFLCWKKLFFFM